MNSQFNHKIDSMNLIKILPISKKVGKKNNYISYHNKSNVSFIGKNTLRDNNEYSLSQNFFDPSKSSPPNDFLIKLYARMNNYQKKEVNLCNE